MTSLAKDDEIFITLLRVAQGDPEIRRRLVAILALETSQREPVLRTFLDEMRMKQAPEEFLRAAGQLLSDDIASTALELLRRDTPPDPGLLQSPATGILYDAKLVVALLVGLTLPPMAVVATILVLCQDQPLMAGLFFSPPVIIAALLGLVLGGTVLFKRPWREIAWFCALDAVLLGLLASM